MSNIIGSTNNWETIPNFCDLPKIYYFHVENIHIYERINFKNNLGNMYLIKTQFKTKVRVLFLKERNPTQ